MDAAVPTFKRRSRQAAARVRTTPADPEPSSSTAEDELTTVSDLLALRQLREGERRSKGTGIGADRLNSSDVDGRRKKKARMDDELAQAAQPSGLSSSQAFSLRKARGIDEDECVELKSMQADVSHRERRSRLNATSFTSQTSALDVDKHMYVVNNHSSHNTVTH